MVAPKTSAAEGFALAESIRLAIEQTPIEGCHNVTVSMGISLIAAGQSIEDAFGGADAALYRAKESGRNRCIMAEVTPADDTKSLNP